MLVAFCVGVQLVSAVPASAARILTITPSAALIDSQTVLVTGSGFSASVNVQYCQAVVHATPSRGDCGAAVPITVSSPTGAISSDNVVRQTIRPATVGHPVDCWVETCVMLAWENDDVAGTAVFSAPLTFVHVQPDGQIRRLSDSVVIGNDVYSPDGSGQTVTHGVAPGSDWSYGVQVQNDGQRTDNIKITAVPGSSSGISIRYFAGWRDVTAAVTGGGFTFTNVPPGGIRRIPVQFRAAPTALLNARNGRIITFQTGNPLIVDTVGVAVVVVAAP